VCADEAKQERGTTCAHVPRITATTIRLPRVSASEDLLDTLGDFHEALRDVAAWIPTIIYDNGTASPRDARWLRAFLKGPLAWHMADEENALLPRLTLRDSAWLDTCLARSCEKHDALRDHTDELLALLEPLCAGQPVARLRFLTVATRFAETIESILRYEDDIVLPSARVFLDASERALVAKEIASYDETRPWLDVAVAGDSPVIHRVHAVRARNAVGLDIVRSFAACPRRRATAVDACAGCPHLEHISVKDDGTGQVSCAIDETAAPNELRVGDVMTRDVICIEKDAPLAEAARLLATACVSGLPVVDEKGRAVGVVSQSDIVDAVAVAGDLCERLVRDVMMHAPIVVREADLLDDAARLLVIEGIHRLPVINGDLTVVGIISTLDLLRAHVGRRRAAGAA
jgi:CBS domain-containing protein